MRKPVVLAALILLPACKTERSAPSAGAAPSAVATTHAAALSGDPLEAVKAKMPKDGAKLVDFDLARLPSVSRKAKGTFVFARPIGWEESETLDGRHFAPKGGLGFRTGITIESSCDGVCVAKDWAPHIDAMLKKSYPDSPTTHDETLPDGRRLRWQVIDGKQAWFRAAWFTPGASSYFSCSGVLDDATLLPYLDAFLEICRTVRVEK